MSPSLLLKPGGILIAPSSDRFKIDPHPLLQGTSSVSVLTTDLRCNMSWLMTGVYGPQSDEDKLSFLNEIRHVQTLAPPKWVVLGDFNLISRASEKSNSNINLRMIRAFRAAIDDLHLRELPLIGRRFTWSNERLNSTLTKIDKVLFTEEWETKYPNYELLPGSTGISDHCPLIIKKIQAGRFAGFRFEAWWPNEEGFSEVVSQAWCKHLHTNGCIRKLHIKLTRTAKALKKWSKGLIKERRFCSAIATEVIFQLDFAMESRQLTQQELDLRVVLKGMLLALAAIQRIRWRQRSRLVWIRVGDANTKLFHLRANGRRRKNHIPFLHHGGHVASDHQDKATVLKEHFTSLLGQQDSANLQMNWPNLNLPSADLRHLDHPFDLDELGKAIKEMAAEKAPGPDGFIGLFFKRCWHIINVDLLNALNHLSGLNATNWNLLNSAFIVLIPKKDNALKAADYRPISLSHSVAKILGKLLANRLAPAMQHLISMSQSAFLKGR